MFELMNQTLHYDDEFAEEYSDEEDYLEIEEVYDEIPDASQYVQVENPELLDDMFSLNDNPLDAIMDFKWNLFPQLQNTEVALSTPAKKQELNPEDFTTPITFNQMLFGIETDVIQETPDLGREEIQTPARKTIGGKTIAVYDQEEMDDVIDIEGESTPMKKKKRPSSHKPRGGKKSKSRLSSSQKVDHFQKPVSVVYNILTQLDTPPTKAKSLEKRISKVFQGEEILKMQKNAEDESEEIDII